MNTDEMHELLSHLAAAHVAFKEAILHLPEESASAPVAGEWSVRHLVCHVSSWDEILTQDLRRIVRGHLPVLASVEAHEIDDWNVFLMRGREAFGHEQALTEFEECYDDLFEELETVPESMLESGHVRQFIETSIDHLKTHAAEIREWRGKQGL